VRPTLFSLPLGRGIELHTYGLAIALGFTLGVVVAARQARRAGLDGDAFVDLLFWILVTGILGSRLAFVLLHAPEYGHLCAGPEAARSWGRVLADCAAPLRIWEGGLVFYGGALGAAGAVALFARRHRWPFGKVADALAPALALGHAVGRVGCFFAGCCYGKPWSRGVVFPRASVAFDELVRAGGVSADAASTPPLHPTQLYEAGGELAIFFVLLYDRRRLRFDGATALLYAILYGALRFGVEIFRADAGRGFVAGGLSVAQVVSVGLVVAAAAVLVHRARVKPAERRRAP
jgi:phosphatidylglycerol:prolipoprotein diacylglycerol transferase